MGFLARLFRKDGPFAPERAHSSGSKLTDDLLIPGNRSELGTFDGSPSAVDALGHETGGPLVPGTGALYREGADLAVNADIGRGMQSDEQDLEESEDHFWDTVAEGARPARLEDEDAGAAAQVKTDSPESGVDPVDPLA